VRGLIVLMLSCRPQPVRPPDTRPLPAPADALAELRAASAARSSLRAYGRVTYFGAKGRVRVRAALLAERPGSFRVETISPFEQPIDVMASDGSRLWLLSEQRLREGPATPENIARLVPLAMNPEEVVDTLLGGVPTSARFAPKELAWAEDGVHWRLSLESSAGERAELEVDPVRRVIERLRVSHPGGSVRLTVAFDDFDAVAGSAGEIPRTIEIEMPDQKLEVSIRLSELEIGLDIPAGMFRIEPPPNVSVEALDSPPAALR
jgi:outer membrane lipoprotein-sorting protein